MCWMIKKIDQNIHFKIRIGCNVIIIISAFQATRLSNIRLYMLKAEVLYQFKYLNVRKFVLQSRRNGWLQEKQYEADHFVLNFAATLQFEFNFLKCHRNNILRSDYLLNGSIPATKLFTTNKVYSFFLSKIENSTQCHNF